MTEARPAGSAERQRVAELDVLQALTGRRILVTGATGFLGKVFIEKVLWSIPNVEQLILLIRPGARHGANERFRDEILRSPAMARLRARHQDGWEEWAASKIRVVTGDLERLRLGLDAESYRQLARSVDAVVSSGATVTFDESVVRAYETNVRGTERLLQFASDAGSIPLLHTSTCFVSGRRSGLVLEAAGEWDFVTSDLHAALRDAALELRDADGERQVQAGAEIARRFDFHDVYTLTKALGERLLEERADRSVAVSILRPAIIESAAREPRPGWIEAVRVADPLLVAYGRGLLDTLPGDPDAKLETVPVDLVAHAMIAALAELFLCAPNAVRYYQLSSIRNPLTLAALASGAREGFLQNPLQDETGVAVQPAHAKFAPPAALRRRLRQRTSGRRAEHFERLLNVFGPYLEQGAQYEDAQTQTLLGRLSDESRVHLVFDVAQLNWREYLRDVHVPGLVRFALRAETGEPPAQARRENTQLRETSPENAARATNLYELFRLAAETDPDTIAFQTYRDGAWLRYSYSQALAQIDNIAACLTQRHGLGHGDRVVLWTSGSPEWILTSLALWRLGAVAVPLDPQWPPSEVLAAARFVDAKIVCAMPRLLDSSSDLPSNGIVTVALTEPFVPAPDVPLLTSADALPDASPATQDDLASILFTSGTTVAPKAVPLTHGNYLANVRDLVPLMEIHRERVLSVLPVHHVFEQTVGQLVPLCGASTISYVSALEPDEIKWMMSTTRPTVMVVIPRLLQLLHAGIFRSVEEGGAFLKGYFKVAFALSKLTSGRAGPKLFSKVHQRFGGSLRRIATGGTALDPELGRSFFYMGFRIGEGYGMTETSPVLTVNQWDRIRFGTAGEPIPSVEIDLRPSSEIAADAAAAGGEIWVRGPNVMSGYYRNEEATAAVMESGWLNTGDVGYFDASGHLVVCGRTKEVIVTEAGKNVYPDEVERRYADLEPVGELVVVGLPAAGGQGEVVAAVITPKTPDATQDQIDEAIRERSTAVPSYQRIGRIVHWQGELPKTTTMKVKRAALRRALLSGETRGTAKTQAAAATAAAAAAPLDRDQQWTVDTLARLVRTRSDQVRAEHQLSQLGVDSLTRVELVAAVEQHFDIEVDDTAALSMDRVQDLFDLVASGVSANASENTAAATVAS